MHEIAAPMDTEFDFSRSGLDRNNLVSHLDAAEAYLQQARSLSAARDAFESEYFNTADFAAWWDRNSIHVCCE